MHCRTALIVACAASAACALSAAAQTPLSRSEALQTALDRGARLGVARADTSVANAALIAARVLPNPGLAASYSAANPNYHVSVEVPLAFPRLRQMQIRSAQLGLQAAQLRFQVARATIALDADTTYTHAIAAREHLALSRRNALDADSLLHMVERRRDAGDAADIDVELAQVNAGQAANLASADSLTWMSTLLDLQAVLGIGTGTELAIRATDSLTTPPEQAAPTQATITETAANISLESATLAARLQHRSIWSTPSINFGFEYHDPGGQTGILPTFGVGIGLPILDRNRGGIAQAEAERARAVAELSLAQVTARNDIAHALRERSNALAKVARDRQLVQSANRVEALSLTAYREGAFALSNVLEAQRNAREILAQYIDDLAAAWIATAELRVLALTPSPTSVK